MCRGRLARYTDPIHAPYSIFKPKTGAIPPVQNPTTEEELGSNKTIPVSILKNPRAADDAGREVRDRMAGASASSEKGARVIAT